ncbi:hypothetical protein K438DRAFT_1842779 [Mycena galopus ATCC 62051]|nr:hypothetical protein K438DRAFT_1842779 [Mycena galopus ATCC 62051]
MRWLFVFWSRRVDARRAAVCQEKSRVTGDSVWKVEGVVAEDVAGQPRDAAQSKRDAARDAFLICGCSPYHVAAFVRRFRAVRNTRLARLGLARVLGSPADRCVHSHCCEREPTQGAHIGFARQRPGIARDARHPAFWLSMTLRESCKSTREVPCSSQPSLMRSSTQPRRRYSIAQTMTTQQGAAQGPCGTADLSERVPVASGRLQMRKSDVAPTMTTQQGAAQGPCGTADLSERVPVASGRLQMRKSDMCDIRGASKFSIPWLSDA